MNIFISMLISMLLSINFAHAMSCTQPVFHQRYMNASAVFEGTVIEDFNPERNCGNKSFNVKVGNIYKGVLGNEVNVSSKGSCWLGTGGMFRKNKEYLFFAIRPKGAFNVQAGGVENMYTANYCSGSIRVGNSQFSEIKGFLEERITQTKVYDHLDPLPNDKKLLVLRAKAEHFLYWHDYTQAESVLFDIIERTPKDIWATTEFLHALYEQHKSSQIWEFYLENENIHKAGNGFVNSSYRPFIHYAAFVLGKEFEKQRITVPSIRADVDVPQLYRIKPRINDVYISGLSRKNTNIYYNNIAKSDLSLIDFSGSKLEGGLIWESRFASSDFTNTDFTTVSFSNSKIENSKLSGADFSNADLRNLKLKGSTYNCDTKWPEKFDPIKAGAKYIEDGCEAND